MQYTNIPTHLSIDYCPGKSSTLKSGKFKKQLLSWPEKKIKGNSGVGWLMVNERRMMQEANEEALMEGILPIHRETPDTA